MTNGFLHPSSKYLFRKFLKIFHFLKWIDFGQKMDTFWTKFWTKNGQNCNVYIQNLIEKELYTNYYLC